MYADRITESMRKTIEETRRRRSIQDAYNKENGVVPKTIIKGVRDVIEIGVKGDLTDDKRIGTKAKAGKLTAKEKATLIEQLTDKMHEAAKRLDFEQAVLYRDRIRELENQKK